MLPEGANTFVNMLSTISIFVKVLKNDGVKDTFKFIKPPFF